MRFHLLPHVKYFVLFKWNRIILDENCQALISLKFTFPTSNASRNYWIKLINHILATLSRFQTTSLVTFDYFFEKAVKNVIHKDNYQKWTYFLKCKWKTVSKLIFNLFIVLRRSLKTFFYPFKLFLLSFLYRFLLLLNMFHNLAQQVNLIKFFKLVRCWMKKLIISKMSLHILWSKICFHVP